MAWVVDTSVVVDLVTGDPAFEPASTACLQAHLGDGLIVSPVTFVELGPSFAGDEIAAAAFLKLSRIGTAEFWTSDDTLLAHRLWHHYQLRRRQLHAIKRPVADVLIAAFAARFQPRNGSWRHLICRCHWHHKASRSSGGITFLMQPLRPAKPCGTKHSDSSGTSNCRF